MLYTYTIRIRGGSQLDTNRVLGSLKLPEGTFVLPHTVFTQKRIIQTSEELIIEGEVKTEFDKERTARMFLGLEEKLKKRAEKLQLDLDFFIKQKK